MEQQSDDIGLYNHCILIGTKLLNWLIQASNIGSGSTWPGHIALQLNKNFVRDVLKNQKIKIILVAGTNGKTTTTKLIRFILEKNGKKVFQNKEGANLLNGIASSLIKYLDVNASSTYDVAIFEVDENTLPWLLEQITPTDLIILNLFRDQLDRYGEVNLVADKWAQALKKLSEKTNLILNGDDPQVSYLGSQTKAKVLYFGLPEKYMTKQQIPHDVDSTYCPRCRHRLTYQKISYSHLGMFSCSNCSFKRNEVETFNNTEIPIPLLGLYNRYNAYSALATISNSFDIPLKKTIQDLQEFQPAYGRQEHITYKGRKITILLAKNPAGFNQSIEVANEIVAKDKANLFILLNDRIPDGRDVSWIWDVEFENLSLNNNELVISGDRTFDLALRFKYSLQDNVPIKKEGENYSFKNIFVVSDRKKALEKAVEITREDGSLVILATYSAMLEVRELILGRKML